MFIGKAENEIRRLFKGHIRIVGEAMEELVATVAAYTRDDPEIEKYSYHLHKLEHAADDVCREIQAAINKGAFLPFFREDYLKLSVFIDKAADRAVDITRGLVLRRPIIPKTLRNDFVRLAEEVARTFSPFRAMADLIQEPKTATKLCSEVSALEQECDAREWKLLKRLFESTEMSRADQYITAEAIRRLSGVADAIENAADRVRLLVIKQSD